MDGLYQITLPYACFGILAEAGRVVDAAPIGRWMTGKPLPYVELWVRSKRGRIAQVPENKNDHGAN